MDMIKLTEGDRRMLSIVGKLPIDDQLHLVATLLRETDVLLCRWYRQWIKDNARYAHILAALMDGRPERSAMDDQPEKLPPTEEQTR
jgi:hypothetical protein